MESILDFSSHCICRHLLLLLLLISTHLYGKWMAGNQTYAHIKIQYLFVFFVLFVSSRYLCECIFNARARKLLLFVACSSIIIHKIRHS